MRRRARRIWKFGGAAVRGGRVRAFTLVELIVAVGAVALLTVGVGQVFQSVGSLVSTGTAVAEIEQLARAIESQMRADFAALNRMREDEVFMAIRCRRVGDINYDGDLDTNAPFGGYRIERALYLTPEDRDADLKAGVQPYEPGSRAVTRRLDEIMFLGFGGDGGLYHSYTPTCKDNAITQCDTCERDVSADTARIYYGHGLRPAIDLTETDAGVDSNGRHWRSYIADGDFGTAAGERNRFDPVSQANSGIAQGRNEYAGDWPLLRHAMLLYGGVAAGEAQNTGVDKSIICNDREFAPYIRDAETVQRTQMLPTNAYNGQRRWAKINPLMADHTRGHPQYNPDFASRPRLMQLGRVDICSQSPEEVQRWLEGYDLTSGTDATAFDDGRYDYDQNPAGSFEQLMDRPLWGFGTSPVGVPANLTLMAGDVGVRSAIAGCFTRYMCETEPPIVNRGDEFSPEDSCDSVMDTHAVLAGRCSNFEIAWSDPQSRWRSTVTPGMLGTLDPVTEERLTNIRSGDVIWYDYSFPRRMLTVMAEYVASGQGYTNLDNNLVGGRQTDPEVLHMQIAGQRDMIGGNLRTHSWREGQVFTTPQSQNAPLNASPMTYATRGFLGYDWAISGGAFDEYMAIFPYRVPDVGTTPANPVDDKYLDQAFPKPQFIRVRMTLHDSQMRLKEGKDFEFIFLVDLQ